MEGVLTLNLYRMNVNYVYQIFRKKNHTQDRTNMFILYLIYVACGFMFLLMLFAFIKVSPHPNKENYVQNMLLTLFFTLFFLFFPLIVIYQNNKSNKLKKVSLNNCTSIETIYQAIKKDDKLRIYDIVTDNILGFKCYLFYLARDSFLEPEFKIYVVYDKSEHSINYTIHLHSENAYGRKWSGLLTYYSYFKKKKSFLQLMTRPKIGLHQKV